MKIVGGEGNTLLTCMDTATQRWNLPMGNVPPEQAGIIFNFLPELMSHISSMITKNHMKVEICRLIAYYTRSSGREVGRIWAANSSSLFYYPQILDTVTSSLTMTHNWEKYHVTYTDQYHE